MGTKTKIRWCSATWNPMAGCSRVSPGCDHCYAEAIAERFRGGLAYPDGFAPTVWPARLDLPRRWASAPRRVFVNSMSDLFHEAFTDDEVDAVFDVMLDVTVHDYLILTKRPKRMARYLLGRTVADSSYVRRHAAPPSDWVGEYVAAAGGYLGRRGLRRLPINIWIGTSIESDAYAWRADWLRQCPAPVRFLSCEPLLGPLPSLDLNGIAWVIVGGESGNGSDDYRPMDHDWARDIRDRCATRIDPAVRHGEPPPRRPVAFFFKQSSGRTTETGVELDGRRWEEYPRPHPAKRGLDLGLPVARYVDPGEGPTT